MPLDNVVKRRESPIASDVEHKDGVEEGDTCSATRHELPV
jgi:hypothetical protein